MPCGRAVGHIAAIGQGFAPEICERDFTSYNELFFFYEVALTTFAVYTLNGHELTASKAFVAWTLFSLIRLQLTAFPDCIVGLLRVSIPGDLFRDGVLVRSSRQRSHYGGSTHRLVIALVSSPRDFIPHSSASCSNPDKTNQGIIKVLLVANDKLFLQDLVGSLAFNQFFVS